MDIKISYTVSIKDELTKLAIGRIMGYDIPADEDSIRHFYTMYGYSRQNEIGEMILTIANERQQGGTRENA